MLWLALQFPQLALEVFETTAMAAEPPTVVLEDNRVVLRNAAAEETSIALGCTLASAHSINSQLAYFHRDPAKEATRLQFLAETLYRFSAQVSIEAPDGLLLEVSGSLKLFGDVAALAHEAVAVCHSLGHCVHQQVATTPAAAMVMARAGASRLADVSLAHTDLAPTMVERFANMGMHTLGPLLQLPSVELGQRFGPELLNLLQRLTGELPEPRTCIHPSAQFERSLHLLDPIRNKDALLFPMQRLLNELQHWLVARQLGAEQLLWHFATQASRRDQKPQAVTLPVRFGKAQQSKGAFANITRLKLEQVELPDDVLTVTLEARCLQPWQAQNQNLFQVLPGELRGDLNDLVDQLRARLGERACHGIDTADQHAPEQAWQKVATVCPAAKVAAKRKSTQTAALPRPIWLFDPPYLTKRQELTLLKGPERIRTAWWQKTIYRDYYIARHTNGAQCWAFVDNHDRWFLHGYFA